MAGNKPGRSTTWNFVFYLDSKLLSPDWRDEMEALHTPIAYIVHDKDDAKPHVHAIVRYDSLKSKEQVQADFAFTGVEYFEQTRSYRGMCRYLIHLDPLSGKEQYTEKYRYDRSEIVELTRERERVATQLEAGLLERYESARKRFKGLAVERLRGNVPSVCRVKLQPSQFHDLAHGEEITECPYCHRILITSEEVEGE